MDVQISAGPLSDKIFIQKDLQKKANKFFSGETVDETGIEEIHCAKHKNCHTMTGVQMLKQIYNDTNK